MGRYRILDTDTHLIEPSDTWTSRLPKAWGDDVLHVRWSEKEQMELWFFGDDPLKAAWQWASWGFNGEGRVGSVGGGPPGPTVQAEAHPAAYDPKPRVQLMDELGVEMQVLYPNLAGFDWAPFVHHPNPELSAAHISAYNDLQMEWVREFPGRFIPMLVVPYWDVPRTIAEIERTADSGFGGIVTTALPHEHDQPAMSSRHWYPMWKACEEAGLSVSFHTSSGDFRSRGARKGDEVTGAASITRGGPSASFQNGQAIADLLLSGILPRFPTLQFVSVESAMGWVPFVLESLDNRFIKNEVAKSNPEFGDMLPSDYFHRQVSVNFWFEDLKDFHIETVGLDRLLWESDFPHPKGYLDKMTPAENIETIMAEQPDDIRQAILWDNPARLYARALKKQNVDPTTPASAAAPPSTK